MEVAERFTTQLEVGQGPQDVVNTAIPRVSGGQVCTTHRAEAQCTVCTAPRCISALGKEAIASSRVGGPSWKHTISLQ